VKNRTLDENALDGIVDLEVIPEEPNIMEACLEDLKLSKKSDNSTKVLLFATFRGGSTFSSNFFRKVKDSMYLFEPLMMLNTTVEQNVDNDMKLREFKTQDVAKLLLLLFHCKFREAYTMCLYYHTRDVCEHQTNWSFGMEGKTLEFVESKCLSAKMRTIKTVRAFHLNLVAPLVDFGVKIVHLVRDPRGFITSRLRFGFNGDYSRHVATQRYWDHKSDKIGFECDCMLQDLQFTSFLVNANNSRGHLKSIMTPPGFHGVIPKWPTHYRLFRYEDLPMDPLNQADVLYSFLEQDVPDEIKLWIRTAKEADVSEKDQNYIMGTMRRNWTETALSWRGYLAYSAVDNIQKQCNQTMHLLGYKLIDSANNNLNTDARIVLDELSFQKILDNYNN
jgi:hypothetical protein